MYVALSKHSIGWLILVLSLALFSFALYEGYDNILTNATAYNAFFKLSGVCLAGVVIGIGLICFFNWRKKADK